MKTAKKTEQNVIKTKLFFPIAVALVIFLFIVAELLPNYVLSTGKRDGARVWREGWYVVTKDGLQSCTVPYGAYVESGEKLILEHPLTEAEWNKWLSVGVLNEFLSVYADDMLIFDQGTMYSPKYGTVPVGGRHYVQIPEGAGTLRMEIFSPSMGEAAGSGRILKYNTLLLGDSEADLIYIRFAIYQYHFVMDVMLISMGIVSIVYGLYLYLAGDVRNLFLRLGSMLVVTGIWLRVGTDNVVLSLIPYPVQKHMAYAAFLLIPFTVSSTVKCYFDDKYKKYRVWQMASLAMIVLYYGLYFAGIYELMEMIPGVHVFFIALGSNLIYDNIRHLREETGRRRYIRLAAMITMALFGCIELFVYYRMYHYMTTGFWLRLGIILCVALITTERLYERRRGQIMRLEQQALQKELQLQVTLSQLQPHFVFNALGAARIMIRTDAETAYDMLYDFSGFLRASINSLRNPRLIPFTTELKQIRNYLNIEQKRFSERIQAVYEIGTEEFEIPPLTVEPLVVNAVYHGLRKGKDRGTVTLRTYREEKQVVVQVIDDGVGFDTKAWEKEHPLRDQEASSGASYMGLENIRSRLLSQAGAQMSMDSSPETGTVITVRIPVRAEEHKEETFIDENDYSR